MVLKARETEAEQAEILAREETEKARISNEEETQRLEIERKRAIEEADIQRQGRPQAQAVLAREVTRLVHQEEGLAAAERITESLFNGSLEALAEEDLMQLRQDGMPASTVSRGSLPETLTQMLTEADMAQSGKQVKDALGRSAVTINNRAVGWEHNADLGACFNPALGLFGRFYLVRLGKKKYHLFELS